MNCAKLERNVIEVMQEQQVKLGFDGNAVYLFYPLSSLGLLLDVDADEETLTAALDGFCAHVRGRLGNVEFSIRDGRVSLSIPPEGCEYVKRGLKEDSFIVRLIRMVAGHHAHMEDVIALFKEYSAHVHAEKMPDGEEFDYLVYFPDGEPDSFYYCLKEDMGHVTYHRFTKADYEAFGF